MIANFLSLGLVTSLALLAGSPSLARCGDYVPQPKPQNVARDVVGADLDGIQSQGFMTFAAYENFPPWSFEQNGEITGVDIDIARLIAADIGVEPRFKLVTAGETLEADLRNWVWKGPVVGGAVANVMLHVPYDSEFTCRVEQVVFTGQYHVEQVAIAYRKDAYPDDPPVPAYFRFDSVAVENDSIADFYLSAFPGGQLGQHVQRYADYTQAMGALARGDSMAAMGPQAELEFALTDALGLHTPPLPGFAKARWTIGVATHFAYKPLAYAVDDAIYAAMQDGRIAAIFARYGLTYSPPALR